MSNDLRFQLSRSMALTGSHLGDALNALLSGYVNRPVQRKPEPVGYDDEPEITRLPDDKGDDDEEGEACGEQRRDEALTEGQARYRDHAEAWSVDHEYRGGDDD